MAGRAVLLAGALALSSLASAQEALDPQVLIAQAQSFEAGLGAPQDFSRAVELYRQAAEAGAPGGLNGLARAYAEGRGVPRDGAQALQFFARAAQSGEPAFITDYAQALEAGIGAEPDLVQAADWYRQAADLGYAPAMTSLGVLALEGRGMEASPAFALSLFEMAADAGDPRAQNNLGLMYSRGDDVERNYAQAARLFEAAARQGLPEAMRNLSVLYENGHGVELNEALAEELLRRARFADAEALDAVLEQVGLAFDRRLEMPDWSVGADPSVTAAARAGDPVALYVSGYQLLIGAGVRAEPSEGEFRLRLAADSGLASASLALGLAYTRGMGVPQDYEEAYFWLSRASLAGLPEAILVRDALMREMPQETVTRAQDRLRQQVTAPNN